MPQDIIVNGMLWNGVASIDVLGENGESIRYYSHGAYYTPTIDEEGNLLWTPVREDMPEIPIVNIRGPQGAGGIKKIVNFSIPTGFWKANTEPESEYKFYYDFEDADISEKVLLLMVLSEECIEEACCCGVCPVVASFEGYARLKCTENPSTEIKGTCYLLDEVVDQTTETINKVIEEYLKEHDISGGGGSGGTDIPTKTSQLENDSGFVTDEDLNEVKETANNASDKVDNLESRMNSGEFKGDDGEPGQVGEKGEQGESGVGIRSVEQTTTSLADGGVNIITITLTDGTAFTFQVKNGSAGSGGEGGGTGADGVGIDSIGQTTTSTEDGGINIVTVTLTDGSSTTFQIRNGSKGGKGDKGDPGETGAPGEDGAKGDKGDTGDNGVSCTHSWNGTTLTVTSASGTSSADLKGDKGDKGDTGATGPKGDTGATGPAYTLTSADKTAITNQVLAAMPYYNGAVS